MGFEYHERRRDRFGRFAGYEHPARYQIHIRLTEKQSEALHRAALAVPCDLRQYCLKAIRDRMKNEHHLDDDEQAGERQGIPSEPPPAGGGGPASGGE